MRLGQLDVSVSSLVATYDPDVLVELLGDNDLSAGQSPAQVAELLDDLVDDARGVDPGIDVVLGQDPRPNTQPSSRAAEHPDQPSWPASSTRRARAWSQRTSPATTTCRTPGTARTPTPAASSRSRPRSRTPCTRWTPPSRPPVPIPTVPLGPRIPPVLSATAGVGNVQLSWIRSPGSQKSDVYLRDVSAGGPFQKVASDQTGTAYTVTGLTAGHTVELQTRPYKGFWIAEPDAWSNVVQVQVLGTVHPSRGGAGAGAGSGPRRAGAPQPTRPAHLRAGGARRNVVHLAGRDHGPMRTGAGSCPVQRRGVRARASVGEGQAVCPGGLGPVGRGPRWRRRRARLVVDRCLRLTR